MGSLYHVVVYLSGTQVETATRYNFNTSHVVVYQLQDKLGGLSEAFQYISCCSLSLKERDTAKRPD